MLSTKSAIFILRSPIPIHTSLLRVVKAPPLSFAARTGDPLYISGIPGFE
jgi:hypothetical protein